MEVVAGRWPESSPPSSCGPVVAPVATVPALDSGRRGAGRGRGTKPSAGPGPGGSLESLRTAEGRGRHPLEPARRHGRGARRRGARRRDGDVRPADGRDDGRWRGRAIKTKCLTAGGPRPSARSRPLAGSDDMSSIGAMPRNAKDVTDAELAVLEALWQRGRS